MTINLADRLSAITTDSAGTTHVVWVENTSLWHAVYNVNSGTWENAQAIANVGNQSLTSLNLIANDKLIQPTSGESSTAPAPGLVVVYQQGSGNDSNLFYTAARYNSGGRTEWLATPQALTADAVGDLAPRAIAKDDGTVFVVGQKVDAEQAKNQAIREDTDLYYQSFTVNQNQFTSGNTSAFIRPTNQKNSYNYLGRNLDAPAANYEILSAEETEFLGNKPKYQGLGANWNASSDFNLNGLSLLIAKKLGEQPDKVLERIFGPLILSISLQGSSGQNPEWSLFGGGESTDGRLLLNALATLGRKQRRNIGNSDDSNRFDRWRRQGRGALGESAQDGFDVSFTLSSLYSYGNSNANSDGKFPLYLETGGALASLAGSIPLFGFDNILNVGLSANFGLFFNAGVALQWQVAPKDPASYFPVLAPYLDLSGNTDRLFITDSFSFVPGFSQDTAILALLSNLEAAFASIDQNSSVELESLLVGIPVTLGFEGSIEIPYIFKLFGSIGFFVDGTFTIKGDTPSSITIGAPYNINVNLLGIISARYAGFPTWTQTFPSSSSQDNQTNTATETNNIASVDGFLLTINLAQSLDPNLNLNPTDFTVTVTNANGQISTIPVFGVVVQTDNQSNTSEVILRLNQEIPYTSLNDQPFANVVVKYTGNQLGTFTDSAVAIISSDTIIYTYNPTSGTGNDYTQNNQQITIAFNASLDPDILAFKNQLLQWFTVTNSSNQSIAITDVVVNQSRIVLTLASNTVINPGEIYTVQYNPDASGEQQLKTANQDTVTAFTVSNGTAPTARGLANGTFVSAANVQTQPVLSNLTSDFAQDTSPALALTSQGDILLAWSSDSPPITPISVLAEGDYIYLVFADNLKNDSANPPSNSQFVIKTSDGNSINPTNVSLAQNTVTLTLNNSVNASQVVAVAYSLSGINFSSNLSLTDATNTSFWIPDFSNNIQLASESNTAPTTLPGSILSNLLTIPFNQTLNVNQIPNGDQFKVTVNGNVNSPINITSVTVNDTSVTLVLNQIIGQGQLVTVTYTPNSNGDNNLVSNASTPQTVAQFSTNNFLTTASSSSTVIKTAFSPFGDSGISSITTIPGTSGVNSDVAAILYTNPSTQTVQNVVAWVNVDTSALSVQAIPGQNYGPNEVALITSAAQQSDIYYAVLGPDNQWSLAAPIFPSQPGQDQKVTLGVGPDDSLLAAWLNTQLNSNGDPHTTIQFATFNGTRWTAPTTLGGANPSINPNSFSELSISSLNGQPVIFWTESQPPSYSNLVSEQNPLLYLRLGELSGTTAINQGQLSLQGNGTYSASGYTLDQVGALENTNTNTGDFNPAVLFNSGGVTINSPVPVSVQGFSVEFWFKLPTTGGVVGLANFAGVFDLSLNGDSLIFALNNGSNTQITEAITANHWHYVVGTYDPVKQILALYVDGQLVDSLENIAFANLPSSGTLTLAGNGGPVYLDEFAFYNSILSHTDNGSSPSSLGENFLNLTGSQLIDGVLGVNEIGSRYQARFFDPVTAGPETNYSVWDSSSNSWQSPVSINPVDEVVPTILAAANNPIWDIVSAKPGSNNNAQITPNGNPDTIFQVNLTGQQGSEIVGFSVTTSDGQLWSLGTNGNGQTLGGWQVGVILAESTDSAKLGLEFVSGDNLLNSLNPGVTFSHRVMGATETFTIFVDTEGSPLTSPATVNVYLKGENNPVQFTSLAPIPNQGGPVSANALDYLGNQVLGIATVKEANDASLSLVDSGFVVNTDNPAIAAVIASGFSNGALAYVAVGNRGYTSQGNSVKGSIQILFAGGDVLGQKTTNALTTTDLSGNPDGVLITGINDTGDINNDVPMALVTGDVDGDNIDDLVIGDANANGGTGRIYVIKGSYLTSLNNQKQIIDLSNASQWTSDQGFVIDGIDAGGGAGFSVAIGNFTGNGPQIAFGAPFAKNSSGVAVGKVYLVSSSNPSQLSPPIHIGSSFSLTNPQNPAQTVTVGETAGYSLGVSRRTTGGPLTFTNNANDDLFIGSSTYGVTINNQWVGKSALPAGNQGNYPDTTTIAAGAVHVFSQPSGQSFGKFATYTGPNAPAANGVGANYLAGAAIALGDFTDLDGDGQQDLAISALGVNGSAGAVYVLSGGKAVASSSDQALNEVSHLTINGGIAGGKAGMTIMTPGDVNGDGYQDFLITAPQSGNGTGQSYLLFGPLDLSEVGQQFNLSVTGTDSKNIFLLNGSLPNQLAGTAVVSLGNITAKTGPNNTPIDSFLISAPNAQQFYVVYGHPWLAADGSIKLSDIASDNGFVIDGNLINSPLTNRFSNSLDNSPSKTSPALIANNGTLYLAYTDSSGQIHFTSSTNDGQTWGQAVSLPSNVQTAFTPSIAFYKDVLYLAYVDAAKGLYVASSTDNGETWNSPYQLGGLSSTAPTLVVYQDSLFFFFTADNSTSSILYFYSDNSNSNAQNPLTSADWIYSNQIVGGNYSTSSDMSATVLDNTLYLALTGGQIGNPTNPPSIYIVSGTGNDLANLTWSDYEVDNISPANQTPGLTTDGETLYLSYTNDSDGNINVITSTDGNNSNNWTPSQTIVGLPRQILPVLATAANQLYFAYAGESQGVYVTESPLPYVDSIVDNGRLVQFLGDINGDGFADIFSGGNNAGAIIFGNSTQDLLTAASGSDDLVISVPDANLEEVISLGDFNGDGFQDVGILANNGNFYVVLGNTNLGDLKTLSITSSTAPVVISQVGGVTKSTAIGDYNGDGYDDVLLWGDNGNQVAWGNAPGSLNNFTKIDYTETQTSATGVDLNGDGIPEIAIGSDQRKIAGQISTAGTFSLLPNPTTASVIDTLAGANQLVNIGDFNGDGIADLAVLASNYYAATLGDPTRLDQAGNQGGVFIYYGSLQGLTNSSQPDVILAAPFTTVSNQQSPFFLSEIAQAGDVNGDGFDDLLISSPFTVTANDDQGSVFVVFGGNNWSNQPFDLGQLGANQNQSSSFYGFLVNGLPDAQAGFAISGGSDVNGDGFDDVVIGAPGNYESQLSQNTVIGDDKGRIWYNGQQINSGNSDPAVISMVVQENASGVPQVVVGLVNGEVWWYNGSSWSQLGISPLTDGPWPVIQMAVQWNGNNPPQVVICGSYGCYYYDGTNWLSNPLISVDFDEPLISQLAVQWNPDRNVQPQIVVGQGPGTEGPQSQVQYYNGANSSLQTLEYNNGSDSNDPAYPITHMAVLWQANGNPQIVTAVGDDGGVRYYNGSSWTYLENPKPGWSSPVTQLSVQWSTEGQPQVLVSLKNGAVFYYDGQGFSNLRSVGGPPISQMAVQWNSDGTPQVVIAFGDKGGVEYYNGSSWITVADNNPGWSSPVTQMSVQWGRDGQPDIVVGLKNGVAIALPYNGSGWDQNGIAGVGTAINQLTSLWSETFVNSGNGDNLSYVLFGSDFNDTVNQTGTIGDDVMLGSPTGESFLAGQGDDQIYTKGGLDVVYAGPGDDWVSVSDTYFRRLDGGTGFDILALQGYNGQNWDITTLSPGLRLQNFETIDIRDYGANQLTLNSLTVTNLSSNNTLVVLMDESGDSLQLSSDFSADGTIYQYGQRFYQYKSNNSAAVVLVNQPTTPSFTAPSHNQPQPILPSGAGVGNGNNLTNGNQGLTNFSDPNLLTKLFVSSPLATEVREAVDFVIERTGNLDKYVLVSYLTQDMDGKAGNRYLPVAGQLIFSPGETSKTVTVEIPNDGIYTGDRQFGLLVSLLDEGLKSGNWGPEFSLAGDGNGSQIRRWNYLAGELENSLMEGIVNFSTTTNDGHTQADINVSGIEEFNDFFSYNPLTGNYESLISNNVTGAKFSYLDGENSPHGVKLTLLDGDRGDADGVSNGLVETKGYLGRAIPGLITNDNRVFWAPTNADGQVQLRLISSADQNYEIGWIAVDDPDGSVNGLRPGDLGYEAAALARKQIVFNNQNSASTQALTRDLAQQSFTDINKLTGTESQFFGDFSASKLEVNRYYMLYSQQGGKTTFSINTSPTVETDSRGYHQLIFDGITAEISSKTLVVPGILNQTITVEASISRAGAYDNAIALYQVDSLTGGLDVNGDRQIDLKPGEIGYLQAALNRAQNPLTGVSLTAPDSFFGTTKQTINLLGNNMYGMVIIPNATIAEVLNQNPGNDPNLGPVALFSFNEANPGGISQMSRLGSNLFGFEDIVGGGDQDYNDVILQFSFPTSIAMN
ncbi:FG-GAP repeat protein [Synechocystis sp. LEGE 06083]|uniref:SwmB domain-containing protein n=1 Tax=Synechocystis sp. LEGE 06083 TaxID=915336 RepID=UPI00187E6E91|nr:SwmB domain-containing protein [Synechocystis sp. LEGE 06083]MBE9193820.1 FG-GAP repeat protein [Synechocystis sp. LEGE 06083]